LTVTGAYTHDELPNLLARANPHLAWFPAQVPETYSYTLSECLRAGLPAVCPNLGAFSERLAGRAWSWICPWDWSAEKWNDFFITARTEHFLASAAPKILPGEPVTADFSYQRDYLVASSSPIPDTETREHPETYISLQRFAYPKNHHTPSHASAAKGRLLQLTLALRRAPLLRGLAKRIPVPWQTRVKTWLLGHS
ncbi:MAG TPA: glycosyl transferase family 2, partial [Gammaproteobacteria bacterium]|nr:glycosyl transferase family 2 [Gammaproteobacteria bacterium]